MRITHFGPEAVAADIRALRPRAYEVEEDVRRIIEEVRRGGDAALSRLTRRFDGADVPAARLTVDQEELAAATAALDSGLRDALDTAIANVRAVARAGLGDDRAVDLPQGQRVELVEAPVHRAGAYAPGGHAAYPSTVVMCAVTAREAGVEELAVCVPPGPGGEVPAVVLAACHLCEVNEVHRVGGAQAIAALAYGTESVEPVDVVVGPGSPWVQEAKRQVFGRVGIDSLAGPSELVIVASGEGDRGEPSGALGVDPELIVLDLLAQAEHGADSLLALITPDELLIDRVEELVRRRGGGDAALALALAADAAGAMALAEAIAPEHLQLCGEGVEPLASAVRSAGCVFVGSRAGTAFGDYVAGSNHVLPTGGAARYASALSPATFRRRMARVSLPDGAPGRLAPAGAALASAEGFPIHGESMTRRE